MDFNLDKLLKIVEISPIWLFPIFAMIGIPQLKNVIDFFELNRSIKLKKFDDAIANVDFEEAEIKYIKELKEQELIKGCTGLNANKQFRASMLEMINRSQGSLSIKDFINAKHLLSIKEGNISFSDNSKSFKFWKFFSYFIFIFSTLSVVVMMFIAFYMYMHNKNIGIYAFLLIMSILNASFYLNETMSYHALKKIKPYLNN